MASRVWWSLLCVLWVGCGGVRQVVRLETGQGEPIVHVPRDAEPVELDEDDFQEGAAEAARDVRPSRRPQEAARALFQMDARGGAYTYEPRSRRITPRGPGEHLDAELPEAEVRLTRAYLAWCERTGRKGDCLLLLVESPIITGDGRFALALALAKGAVLEEMLEAFRDMADPEALVTAALWTMTMYAILWTVPEPFSKGVAATLTAALIVYVGVDTFRGLVQGFRRLWEESERATTFDELGEAGERYGKVMGRNAARAFAMLAMAAVGSTPNAFAAKLPRLPGVAQATVRAEAQAGIVYGAVGQVETVAVTAEGVTLSLAPGAVAMVASGSSSASPGFRAWKSHSGFKKAMGPAGPGKEWHHIVEQTPGNVQRFGPEALHNTENVIPLDKGLHTRVSAFYSSIQESVTRSPRLTVRQWLSTQSYEAQRDFGLSAIENIRKGLWR
ncbi:hypothetical protein HPC49_23275 [Pyxidicoccus fallax]|uniref:Lipoprotein n=1 Tax=Pyxidicoccus fallax TaxID=394095 RepID=A0A848L421_9BACT|nr:hypothetical protein [Pyxidicoccus fallax]NMO13454.1 hypothetical protein [Pyxidicoccus fallax]NPC81136.1 hypothetical protein [Pyxidicoccus fallax]